MVIIIWAMYLGESKDYSYIIATGVIGAGVTGNTFIEKNSYKFLKNRWISE